MRQELCLGLSEPFFLSRQNIGKTGTVTRECKIKPLKWRGFILHLTAVPHFITEQRKKVNRLLKQSS